MTFDYSLSGKWLELLKEIAPSVTRAAVLRDPAFPAGIGQLAVIQILAPPLRLDVSAINVRDAREIERAVATFASCPIPASRKWRSGRHGEPWYGDSSRSNCCAGGPA